MAATGYRAMERHILLVAQRGIGVIDEILKRGLEGIKLFGSPVGGTEARSFRFQQGTDVHQGRKIVCPALFQIGYLLGENRPGMVRQV